MQTRWFLHADCTFNLLTGTGYFLFSGVGGFGDGALVIAGTHPQWLWPRMKKLTWLSYFSALMLSLAGGFMNPLGSTLVVNSALPAAAGGNAGLLWLRRYVPKGRTPRRQAAQLGRGYAWIAVSVLLSMAFIFVLGRGITLQR